MEDRPWQDILEECLTIIAANLNEREERLTRQITEYETRQKNFVRPIAPAVGYNGQGNNQ